MRRSPICLPRESGPDRPMFSCACSLRSTQCAALIALATAAGLCRIGGETSAASDEPVAETQTSTPLATASARPAHRLTISGQVSPWLSPVATVAAFISSSDFTGTSTTGADRSGTDAAPGWGDHAPAVVVSAPALAAQVVHVRVLAEFAVTNPQCRLPYAVGPPAEVVTFTRRALALAASENTARFVRSAARASFPARNARPGLELRSAAPVSRLDPTLRGRVSHRPKLAPATCAAAAPCLCS